MEGVGGALVSLPPERSERSTEAMRAGAIISAELEEKLDEIMASEPETAVRACAMALIYVHLHLINVLLQRKDLENEDVLRIAENLYPRWQYSSSESGAEELAWGLVREISEFIREKADWADEIEESTVEPGS